MSTTVVETFTNLISNFNNLTSSSTSTTSWNISFNEGSNGFGTSSSILGNPNSFGNAITFENNSLCLYGSNIPLKLNNSSIYTNPGETKLKYSGTLTNLSSVVFNISGIPQSTNQYYRSYDAFEDISATYLSDSFNYENTFIGLSDSNIEIGIVILKAPSKLKYKNKNQYVNSILGLGAIGNSSYPDYSPICDSSMFSENERIISIVYKQNGKYYDTNGNQILDYSSANSLYSFRYTGSSEISSLNLSNVGSDGRYIKNIVFDNTNVSSTYLANLTSKTNIVNESFYPLKENNTWFNSFSISNTNQLSVAITRMIIGSYTNVSFIVTLPNGNKLTSSIIQVPSIDLTPTVSVVDFSNNSTLNISEAILTFDSSGNIDNTVNALLSKYVEPTITFSVGSSFASSIPTNPSNILIPQGENLYVNFIDNQPGTTLYYTINQLVNGSYVNVTSGTSTSSIDYTLSSVGEYQILSHISSNGSTQILDSKIVTIDFTIYYQAKPPVITQTEVALGGGLEVLNVQIIQADHVDCYFSINGTAPDGVTNTFTSKYINGNYPTFTFENNVTIYAYAMDSNYNKSVIVEETTTALVKTVTLSNPVITSTYYQVNDNYVVTITSTTPVYYTTDGSIPTINSNYYSLPFTVNPVYGETITINAISIQSGAISSSVVTDTLICSHICSPWIVEQGILTIEPNLAMLFVDTTITRVTHSYDTYSMNFQLIDILGIFDLMICTRETVLDNNNYTSQYLLNDIFNIVTTYSDSTIATISLGKISKIYERDNINYYGELIWNKTNPLNVTYFVSKNNGAYFNRITISNGTQTIDSGYIPMNYISSTAPTLMAKSIVEYNAYIKISNIVFSCF